MRTSARKIQPTRRGQKVIDCRPLVEQNRAAAALRARKGLVSEWAAELNRLPSDLRAMAENLMAEIANWFVNRPQNWRTA